MKFLTPLLPLLFVNQVARAEDKPADFVSAAEVAPQLIVDMKYAGSENFLGRPVKGYAANTCYLAAPVAKALAKVQKELLKKELSLKVYDCYRPQMAVDDFVQWSKDLKDQATKDAYYPNVPKEKLFKQGYIAAQSGHSRGATVDITLVDLKTNEELDMGTHFDFFDIKSTTANLGVDLKQKKNRLRLKAAMEREGFENYLKEWWHYSLEKEPYPKTYFNFEVQ